MDFTFFLTQVNSTGLSQVCKNKLENMYFMH